ncbi:hypothetical protein ATKI12_7113 [Kitasatospora sp. Ki12]
MTPPAPGARDTGPPAADPGPPDGGRPWGLPFTPLAEGPARRHDDEYGKT